MSDDDEGYRTLPRPRGIEQFYSGKKRYMVWASFHGEVYSKQALELTTILAYNILDDRSETIAWTSTRAKYAAPGCAP